MSEFLIRVLKWLAALVTAYFLLFLLVFLVIIGIGVALQPAPKAIEPDSILVLDLDFNLTDQPQSENPMEIARQALQGELLATASLREVLETLEAAAEDAEITGLFITGNLFSSGYGGSFAALRELRQGILSLGEKKTVWSYLDGESLRDLYIKSAATEVLSNPNSIVNFRGLRAERLYMGDAFEKMGIEVQVDAHGRYKSAAESFQRGTMSEAEREQLALLLDDIWGSLVSDIAQARSLTPETLDALAGNELFIAEEEVVASGLSDRELSHQELVDYLSEQSKFDPSRDSFRQVSFIDYMETIGPQIPVFDLTDSGNQVAVIYAEGILVDGEGDETTVGSKRLIKDLREMRNDDSVKAIVLRINSPGGSSSAGFKVAREIELTNSEKPVIISLGGIAASGGYLIAAPGDYIFAEPTTITGSIGVVSMLPNIQGLAEKLSLNFDGVETHPFAGSFSLARPLSPEGMQQLKEFGARIYDRFLSLVAEKRGLSMDMVLSSAEGRVWSGVSALERNLVDEIGGLSQAIKRAADTAGIGDDFRIMERPRRLTLEQQIEEFLYSSRSSALPVASPNSVYGMWKTLENEIQRLTILSDPHGIYLIQPYSLKIL